MSRPGEYSDGKFPVSEVEVLGLLRLRRLHATTVVRRPSSRALALDFIRDLCQLSRGDAPTVNITVFSQGAPLQTAFSAASDARNAVVTMSKNKFKRGCDERLHNVCVKGVFDLSSMQINYYFPM